ncbi:hypothetical protein OCUBac02_21010 [Bosea sp. ANAM02]|nr:hypothetical protein OCUBac02_21010 [Bosea sp. ANAM02]
MSSRELQELHRHLSAAVAIVQKLLDGSPDASLSFTRNPHHFRETGHLSDAGIETIYKLFDDGRSIEQAAQEMGISIRGAASRRRAWAKRSSNQ